MFVFPSLASLPRGELPLPEMVPLTPDAATLPNPVHARVAKTELTRNVKVRLRFVPPVPSSFFFLPPPDQSPVTSIPRSCSVCSRDVSHIYKDC
jgi:hypothetical protein